MAEGCSHCAPNQPKSNDTNALFGVAFRAAFAIILGIFYAIPAIETLLSTGILGTVGFTVASLVLACSVYYDFKNFRLYALSLLPTAAVALCLPLLATAVFPFIIAVTLCTALLFVHKSGWQFLGQVALALLGQRPWPRPPSAFLEVPSPQKLILLFVILNWGMSLGSLLPLASTIYHNVLHDALLTLGVFNLGEYIRSSLQTSASARNDHKTISIKRNHPTTDSKSEIKQQTLSSLKKGDVIVVQSGNSLLLPVKCRTTQSNCRIICSATESQQTLDKNTEVEKSTLCMAGEFTCLEDYQAEKRPEHRDTSNERMMQIFLLVSLCIALTAGIGFGLLSASLVLGLQHFCLNLVVCCPCIFLVSKPIIEKKIHRWLQKNQLTANNLPSIGQPDIVVFDRTHTLYTPSNDEKSDYTLSASNKKLLRRLKENGVKIFILSGHHGDDAKRHHHACCSELRGIVEATHIHFNAIYHNDPNAKADVIRQLQQHGKLVDTVDAKTHTKKFTVAMVGDGSNDRAALKQADCGIYVAPSQDSPDNQQTAANAHFCVAQNNLAVLSGLFATLGHARRANQYAIACALIYNVCMLGLINGGFAALFGLGFPPAAACLVSSLFCTGLIFCLSCTTVGTKEPTPRPVSRHECSRCRPQYHTLCTHKRLTPMRQLSDETKRADRKTSESNVVPIPHSNLEDSGSQFGCAVPPLKRVHPG